MAKIIELFIKRLKKSAQNVQSKDLVYGKPSRYQVITLDKFNVSSRISTIKSKKLLDTKLS